MFFLPNELWFPDQHLASKDGLLAIGGDFHHERLLLAYRSGIFPWFMEAGEIYWFCPPERMVLFPEHIHISNTMKKVLHSKRFRITEDADFARVIRSCATVHREQDHGTWINEDFIQAYTELHRLGFAHSIEVWHGEELVGGMYGVAIGKLFCGESMFSTMNNASKAAMIHVCQSGKYALVDCQVATSHLYSMGAQIMSRNEFLQTIKKLVTD